MYPESNGRMVVKHWKRNGHGLFNALRQNLPGKTD
jgi:hypothetical protein